MCSEGGRNLNHKTQRSSTFSRISYVFHWSNQILFRTIEYRKEHIPSSEQQPYANRRNRKSHSEYSLITFQFTLSSVSAQVLVHLFAAQQYWKCDNKGRYPKPFICQELNTGRNFSTVPHLGQLQSSPTTL